uniref:Uncharacterized protein n=1 Tax=Rhizophora mucronata TaxID=61149 RepID=A0A2P2QDI6_RHIMU
MNNPLSLMQMITSMLPSNNKTG